MVPGCGFFPRIQITANPGTLFGKLFSYYEFQPCNVYYLQIPAQEAAGLRGSLFTTTAVESVNSLIKRDVLRKRTPLQFAEDMETLVEKQTVEFEYAIIGKGEFQLIPQYRYSEVSFKRYSMMTSNQKNAAVKKMHTEVFDPKKEIPKINIMMWTTQACCF